MSGWHGTLMRGTAISYQANGSNEQHFGDVLRGRQYEGNTSPKRAWTIFVPLTPVVVVLSVSGDEPRLQHRGALLSDLKLNFKKNQKERDAVPSMRMVCRELGGDGERSEWTTVREVNGTACDNTTLAGH